MWLTFTLYLTLETEAKEVDEVGFSEEDMARVGRVRLGDQHV